MGLINKKTFGLAAETWIMYFRAKEKDIYKNMTAKEIMEVIKKQDEQKELCQ